MEKKVQVLQAQLESVQQFLADESSYQSENADELQLKMKQQVEIKSSLETAEEDWLEKMDVYETESVRLEEEA